MLSCFLFGLFLAEIIHWKHNNPHCYYYTAVIAFYGVGPLFPKGS